MIQGWRKDFSDRGAWFLDRGPYNQTENILLTIKAQFSIKNYPIGIKFSPTGADTPQRATVPSAHSGATPVMIIVLMMMITMMIITIMIMMMAILMMKKITMLIFCFFCNIVYFELLIQLRAKPVPSIRDILKLSFFKHL